MHMFQRISGIKYRDLCDRLNEWRPLKLTISYLSPSTK